MMGYVSYNNKHMDSKNMLKHASNISHST